MDTVDTTPGDAHDPHSLERFVAAQDDSGTYDRALREIRAGRKTSHWMWFVFPQIAGLGSSPTSRFYAVRSVGEASAYRAHPVLGSRLHEASDAVLHADAPSAAALLGGIDAQKLRSSMTLFGRVAPEDDIWRLVLDRWFDGVADDATERLLGPTR